MADRSYIIEVLLQARDDTARAFASATGQMDAYDAKLDEQRAKSDALAASNGRLSTSYKKLREDQGAVAQGHQTIIARQVQYQRAAESAARAESQRRQGDIASQNAAVIARQKLLRAQKDLTKSIDDTAKSRKKYDAEAGRSAQTEYMAEARNNALLKERTRILGQLEKQTNALSQAQDVRQIDRITGSIKGLRTEMDNLGVKTEETDRVFEKAFDTARLEQHRAAMGRNTQELQRYQRLVDQVAQAERKRDIAVQKPGLTDEQRGVIKERLDVDVGVARAHLEEFRLAQRAKGIDIPIRVHEDDIQKARQVADAMAAKPKADDSGGGGGGGGFLGMIASAEGAVQNLNKSVGDTGGAFQGAFGMAATLMQPLATAILGLVGTMTALYSAAVAAGGALGGLFVSAGAQGVPAMGLLAASMQRLTSIVGYVQAAHQQLQQRFIAGFQTAHLNALGINQVTSAQHAYQQALLGVQQSQLGVLQAEHGYSNALFAQQQAVRNVGIATFNLSTTRQQATRQLQDLILQERAAKLAAEASSLAVTDAQKALRAAIATGGDVQQAQLGLQQAQVQHVQATVGAQRAIRDAARGSLARQGIEQQVSQAENAVVQARRAVVDANFSVTASAQAITSARAAVANAEFGAQQARAAIALAREQAAGYNAGTAAQLAWLRSQMTGTEKALAGNIQRIYGLFQGVSGRLRPMTDAILRPFIGITGRILQLFQDPKFMGAFQNLANQMGAAFGSIGKALLSDSSIKAFEGILRDAAANMKPLANIAISFFRGMQSIVVAAAPFVHNFLLWISDIAQKFSVWAASARGQNWLKQFFDIAFQSLKAFLSLGMSIARLILAIAGAGGGAKTGIGLLQTLQRHIDNTTRSINSHGHAFHTLQVLWASAKTVLSVLGTILGAVGHAMMQLGGTQQGRQALKNIGDIIAKIIIPGLTQAFMWLGRFSGAILNFVKHHPTVAKFAKEFIAIALAVGVMHSVFSKLLGPLGSAIGLVGKAGGAIKLFQAEGLAGLAGKLGPIGPMMLEAFGNPIVLAVVAVTGAIIGLAAATGNLGKLGHILTEPFKILWRIVKPLLQQLEKAFIGLFRAFGVHTKNAHDVVGHFLDILGFLMRAFMAFSPVVRGIVTGITILTGAIKFLTNIINTVKHVFEDVFRTVSDIVHGRFGKLPGDFLRIGKDIVKGLWNGIKIIGETVLNVFKGMINAVLKFLGISSPSTKFHSIGKSMVDGVVHAFTSLPNTLLGIFKKAISFLGHIAGDAFNAGWGFVQNIGKGIASGFKWVVNNFIVGPLNWIIDKIDSIKVPSIDVGPIHLGGGHLVHIGKIAKMAQGGSVGFGYGGGDRHPALLEAGEHVFSKEEVRAAGGHGAIFAIRRLLGGGGQGGPFGYAVGGAVGGAPGGQTVPGVPHGVVGSGQMRSEDYQGVHGTLGGDLHNVQNFAKRFRDDWKAMWDAVNKETINGIRYMETQWTKLRQNLDNIWGTINSHAVAATNTLYKNVTSALSSLDNAIFNAFWYVQHATNASLKAFNAPPVKVDLGGIPKFAGGGRVGQKGERGKDLVHALLGRGEAVLNWGHQKIVDPALRAMYGFGLDEMFDKVRTTHSQMTDYASGFVGGAKGYAAGGYVYPLPGFTIGRTDMGIDANAPTGTPILAIGDSTLTGVIQGWYAGQPLLNFRLDSGPMQGRYWYVAEQIIPVTEKIGSRFKAGQAVARYAPSGSGIEIGWSGNAAGQTLAQTTTGYSEGQQTAAGKSFLAFISGLAHGKLVMGGPAGGAAAAAMWKQVQEVAVKGSGAMALLARKAIKKVTDAANKFGESKAGTIGSASNTFNGTLTGPVPHQVYQFMSANGFNKIAIAGMLGNAVQESSMNPNEAGGGLWQQISNFGSGTGGSLLHQMQTMLPQIQSIKAALNAAGSPGNAAVIFEQGFERAGIPAMANRIAGANAAYAAGYAKGGFADDRKGPAGGIPIVAHAGEWLVNEVQQRKIAGRMGMTVERLKKMLNFSGGPIHFAGGGAPGEEDIVRRYEPRGLSGEIGQVRGLGLGHEDVRAVVDALKYLAYEHRNRITLTGADAHGRRTAHSITGTVQQFITMLSTMTRDEARKWLQPWVNEMKKHVRPGHWGSTENLAPLIGHPGNFGQLMSRLRLIRPDPTGTYTGTINWNTGAYKAPDIMRGDDPALMMNALARYNYAQTIVTRIRSNSKKFDDSIKLFMKNFNIVGGDNGIFAIAAQAVADFSTSQQNMVSLAASGVRMIGQRLRFGRAPTALRDATVQLNATNRIITQLRGLQSQERDAYSAINREISRVQGEKQTDATRKQLEQLLGARAQMLKTLRDTDGQLAQSLTDRFDQTSAVFQAQTDQMMRGRRTLGAGQIGAVMLGTQHSDPGLLRSAFNNLHSVLGKAGPTIAQGLAQMAQSIAQTLGNPQMMQQADTEAVSSAQRIQDNLRKRYNAAAQKAQTDPRWQKVADDLLGQLEGAVQGTVQATAQALTDRISAQDTRSQLQQTAVDMWNRILAVQAGLGNQLGAAQGQIAVSRTNTGNLQGQLAAYQGLLGDARAQGNVQAVNDLTTKISDLTAQIAEANLQTQQLITAYRQLTVTMLQTQTQASSGLFSAANTIATTLGAISGNMNLPALINYAKEAGQTLISEGQKAVRTITDTMNDPNRPFGQFQGQANDFLGQLTAAFNAGPQQFADTLGKLAPSMSSFEAGLPQDQLTLFQNLVQALIDNTTSQTANTQTLKDLQAQNLQQQFTSSAWTLFRQAIFDGLGGLLPQYAMAVPMMDVGGAITRSGLLYGHMGEEIMPANVARGYRSGAASYGDVNVNVTHPMETADPVYLGNEIAWRLAHDPNSR